VSSFIFYMNYIGSLLGPLAARHLPHSVVRYEFVVRGLLSGFGSRSRLLRRRFCTL